MEKYNVIVKVEPQPTGRVNISVGQPEGEEKLSFVHMAHVLASGISLIVRLSKDVSNKQDYELLKDVIDQLHNEFVSLTSFNDARIFGKETV